MLSLSYMLSLTYMLSHCLIYALSLLYMLSQSHTCSLNSHTCSLTLIHALSLLYMFSHSSHSHTCSLTLHAYSLTLLHALSLSYMLSHSYTYSLTLIHILSQTLKTTLSPATTTDLSMLQVHVAVVPLEKDPMVDLVMVTGDGARLYLSTSSREDLTQGPHCATQARPALPLIWALGLALTCFSSLYSLHSLSLSLSLHSSRPFTQAAILLSNSTWIFMKVGTWAPALQTNNPNLSF